jgi:hypothetical protein
MNEEDYDYYIESFAVGAYGGLDDTSKRRKKKHPVGFAVPSASKTKAKARRKTQPRAKK